MRRLIHLPLLVEALVCVAAARCALLFFGVAPIARLAARIRPARRRHSVDLIAWAVAAAGRRVPKSTCLAEALAAQALMRRNGWAATLCIGVSRAGSSLQRASARSFAHAWVEYGGRAVVGASEAGGFTRILQAG